MTDAQFSIAFRLGARKALRQGKIQRDEFRLVKGILREPVRPSPEYGSVNILAAVKDFVTGQMLADEPDELPQAGIMDLIAYIIENMDSIMAFIQQLIDLFSGVGDAKPETDPA